MAVRLRLQRHGKKGKPFYHVVAADHRAKRDGKYIERIGAYNPTTVPATIELDVEAAVKWLQNGAEPTNTVKAILSYKGALYKNHLLNGVRKGAFTLEQAEAKFQTWTDEKSKKIGSHEDRIAKSKENEKAKKLAAEKEVNEKRLAEFQAKQNQEAAAAEAEAAEQVEEEVVAETAAEVVAETEVPAAETEQTSENTEDTAAEEPKAE